MGLRPLAELWLPKAGNSAEEYEDSFRVLYPEQDGESGHAVAARIAVADGATESAFAREWADALADAYVAQPPELDNLTEDSLTAWLVSPQGAWHDAVPWDRLPWHAEPKTRAGAYATLVGLAIQPAPDDPEQFSWEAVAVGDSCLFVIRDDALCVSFPLHDAAEFDNSPALICSNPNNTGELWDGVRLVGGKCAAGDVFILASDALARRFLVESAAGEKPWQTLLALEPQEWEAWIEELRREKLMRNDDTTMVVIEVE